MIDGVLLASSIVIYTYAIYSYGKRKGYDNGYKDKEKQCNEDFEKARELFMDKWDNKFDKMINNQ